MLNAELVTLVVMGAAGNVTTMKRVNAAVTNHSQHVKRMMPFSALLMQSCAQTVRMFQETQRMVVPSNHVLVMSVE